MPRSALFLAVMVAVSSAFAADEPSVEMEIDRIATATPDQMGLMAEEAERMIAAAETALQKLAASKRGGGGADDSSLDCTTDRIGTVAQLKAQAGPAAAAMRKALDDGNVDRAASELRKLAVAAREGRSLADQAKLCAEGVTESTGRSRITPSGGVGDPDADTAKDPNDVLDVATDPTSASPF
jgi:hypothetical protein